MNPAITQTFGQQLLPHNTLPFIIGFVVAYLIINVFGTMALHRLVGAFFGGLFTVFALFAGMIPFWEALVFLFISFIQFGSWFIRGVPEEKPTETPQKPPEITGSFDKAQFKRGK